MNSDTSVFEELAQGATRFLNLVVPPLGDRQRITWRTFPYTLSFLVPVLFMAYLARRPNTRLIRLLMLPSAMAVTLHSCYGYVWVGPGFHVYNWGEALVGMMITGKVIDFALTPNGHYKIGEKRLGEDSEPPGISKKDYDHKASSQSSRSYSNGHALRNSNSNSGSIHVTGETKRPSSSSILPVWLQDALELFCSARGIGWDWGKGVYIPTEHKPLEKHAFLSETISSFIWSFFALDFLESCLKLVPGVGSPTGGTIFLPNLPSPLHRYALSTAIHFATGFALVAGFQMCYDLATVIGVGLLGHHPSSWPPVLDRPWAATSLHDFWARRWHQLLRQTFLVFGGLPVYTLLGGRRGGTVAKIGTVLGAFLASGMYHELSSAAMGRGIDYRVILFFILQGVLVVLERVWKVVTGKRVSGWFGTVWVYFVVGVVGQPLVDAWHKKGLAGGMIIPPIISPTRRYVFPVLAKLTGFDFGMNPL